MRKAIGKWILIWVFFIATPLIILTHFWQQSLSLGYATLKFNHSPKITVNYDAEMYCTLSDEDFSTTLETVQSCLYRLGKEAGLSRNSLGNLGRKAKRRKEAKK